jgi:hypothetical protein
LELEGLTCSGGGWSPPPSEELTLVMWWLESCRSGLHTLTQAPSASPPRRPSHQNRKRGVKGGIDTGTRTCSNVPLSPTPATLAPSTPSPVISSGLRPYLRRRAKGGENVDGPHRRGDSHPLAECHERGSPLPPPLPPRTLSAHLSAACAHGTLDSSLVTPNMAVSRPNSPVEMPSCARVESTHGQA